jgi:hypothetical protein
MRRRHVIATAGGLGLASLAGCLGLVGLDRHEATPAGVEPSVRDETGYEQTGIDDHRVEEEVGVSPLAEEVVVMNSLTEHEKAVDMGPLGDQRGAEFTVLTTPKVDVAGRPLNPIEELSTAELVELVADNYDGIEDVERDDDEEVTVLERSTTMSTFTADAVFSGTSIDVALHVTEAVEAGDDLLVTVGVYPTLVESQEAANVQALIDAVVADADDA